MGALHDFFIKNSLFYGIAYLKKCYNIAIKKREISL